MNKANKLVATLLLFCVTALSCGLLYVSIYASSGASMQSSQTVVAFDAPSGIRYNRMTDEFEVFSYEGISWIASGKYISILGEVEDYGDFTWSQDWSQASNARTYNIMCDITYPTTLNSKYNSIFMIKLAKEGVLDGRGFYLKGFPIRANDPVHFGYVAAALVHENLGTIRNVNLKDVRVSETGLEEWDIGLICASNYGTIENSSVYGSYSVSGYKGIFGIAAVNNGLIMNCGNSAKIESKTVDGFAAGIASIGTDATFINNINNGIVIAKGVAGGIAIAYNDIAFICRGNRNNNLIESDNIAAGIVGSLGVLSLIDAAGNDSNGNIKGVKTYQYFFTPTFMGIKWNSGGYFEVHNADGVSFISSGIIVNNSGYEATPDDTNARQALPTSKYKIMNSIAYDEQSEVFNAEFNTKAPSILDEGEVDGGGKTLSGFPIRRYQNTNRFSALFYEVTGTVKNLKLDEVRVSVEDEGIQNETAYIGTFAVSSNGLLDGCELLSNEIDFDSVLSGVPIGATANKYYIGGIVAVGAGNIFNCISKVNISLVMDSMYVIFGGVVGLVGTRNGGEFDSGSIIIKESEFISKINVFAVQLVPGKNAEEIWIGGMIGETGVKSDSDLAEVIDCGSSVDMDVQYLLPGENNIAINGRISFGGTVGSSNANVSISGGSYSFNGDLLGGLSARIGGLVGESYNKPVKVDGASVSFKSRIKCTNSNAYLFMGGVVAYASNRTDIQNVSVNADAIIEDPYNVGSEDISFGGFVGTCYSGVTFLQNELRGSVSSTATAYDEYVGLFYGRIISLVQFDNNTSWAVLNGVEGSTTFVGEISSGQLGENNHSYPPSSDN